MTRPKITKGTAPLSLAIAWRQADHAVSQSLFNLLYQRRSQLDNNSSNLHREYQRRLETRNGLAVTLLDLHNSDEPILSQGQAIEEMAKATLQTRMLQISINKHLGSKIKVL